MNKLDASYKMHVINEVDKGDCRGVWVPVNTFWTFVKYEEEIFRKRKPLKIKAFETPDIGLHPQVVFEWLQMVRDQKKYSKYTDFIASVSWLTNFKKRHTITQKAICSESVDVSKCGGPIFYWKFWPHIIQDRFVFQSLASRQNVEF